VLKRFYFYMNDLIIFILIFSFFNDNFLVDIFGGNILKIIFLIFLVTNFHILIKNLYSMHSLIDKIFFVLLVSLLIIFLIQNILQPSKELTKSIFSIISLFAIVTFFSRFNLQKTLYFIWASMIASIIICYFNEPLTPFTFRTTGGTGDPNEFAAQLLAFLFSSFYLYSKNKSKFFLFITIVFFTYGLFKAGSMSSFLMLGIVGLFVFIKYLYKLINYKALIVLILSILVFIQFDFTNISGIKNMLNRSKDTHTAQYRIDSWKAGLNMVQNHPLIGIGINEFSYNTQKYSDKYIHSPAPHNIFIQILAEAGILFFIVFIVFLYFLFTYNFQLISKKQDFWLIVAFISMIFMGITLGIFYDKYFMLYISIVMNIHYQVENQVQEGRLTHENCSYTT